MPVDTKPLRHALKPWRVPTKRYLTGRAQGWDNHGQRAQAIDGLHARLFV